MLLSFDANIFIYANISGDNISNKEKRDEWKARD